LADEGNIKHSGKIEMLLHNVNVQSKISLDRFNIILRKKCLRLHI